ALVLSLPDNPAQDLAVWRLQFACATHTAINPRRLSTQGQQPLPHCPTYPAPLAACLSAPAGGKLLPPSPAHLPLFRCQRSVRCRRESCLRNRCAAAPLRSG